MQTTNVLVSRFRDSLTDGALPLTPEAVSIHPHVLEPGRCLVVIWGWDDDANDYRQTAVVNAESIEEARGYLPAARIALPVPAGFALEAYVAVNPVPEAVL